MWDYPEEGELDPADGVRRRCNKNSSSVSKEGCDRGSEVGTVHSGLDGEGPVPLMKPKESGGRESFGKISVSR